MRGTKQLGGGSKIDLQNLNKKKKKIKKHFNECKALWVACVEKVL